MNAALSCNGSRTYCTWSVAGPPLSGLYVVNARATDSEGNVETPGPTITVIVA